MYPDDGTSSEKMVMSLLRYLMAYLKQRKQDFENQSLYDLIPVEGSFFGVS